MFGGAAGELDLVARTVILNDGLAPQRQGAAEQKHMAPRLRLQVRLDQDLHIQGLGKLLVPQLGLMDAGIDTRSRPGLKTLPLSVPVVSAVSSGFKFLVPHWRFVLLTIGILPSSLMTSGRRLVVGSLPAGFTP